ncbi:MAG: cation:proton antiporter [Ruegeria sp.]|uniref:cation:proton antiporter domain-containing protein n=1 Tax=Ruegeria sp. TaxID=1879320 RepID=UPI00349EFB28
MSGLIIVSCVTAAYCLMAVRLSRTIVTAPMLFLALGVGLSETGLLPAEGIEELLHPIAEVALIVLLFLDAAQTDLGLLKKRHIWPQRMLLLGLPLAILLGALAAWAIVPGWSLLMAALAAAILSPTDAALGQPVVTNPDVPLRPRRALIVESGLNDGLALPAILLLAAVVAHDMTHSSTDWLLFGAKQVVLGPLAGATVGLVGGWALLQAKSLSSTSEAYEGIAAIAMAGGAYLLAGLVGGNGFISAFAAGLCFGNVVKGRCKFVYEFTEGDGQILAWAAFLLIGAGLVPEAVAHLTWPMLVLILASLFVVRPLAIWVSLIGTDASALTRVFFGWFGPRGLATALFALLVLETLPHGFQDEVLHLAINAVWISAVLHGITAAPAARWYGKMIAGRGACPETEQVDAAEAPLTHNT